MIISVLGYGADHPLAADAPNEAAGILYRASGVRRFQFNLEDGSSVDVSGADIEEWVRLYAGVGNGATAQWTTSPLSPGGEPRS